MPKNAPQPTNNPQDNSLPPFKQELDITPLISYPTRWEYIIIGKDENHIKSALDEILLNKEYEITAHKVSAKGNFTSIHIALEVASKEERDEIFHTLKSHSAVNMVI
ncbi:HP0495 family protein [Helicobacter sp. 23-1046]